MNWTESGLAVADDTGSWLISQDGEVLSSGTHQAEATGDVVWDGTRFAIFGQGALVGDAGSATEQWTDVRMYDNSRPVFVDNGQELLLTAPLDGNRNEEIYVVGPGNTTRLTEHPGSDRSPAPWGTKILFISDRGGERHLQIRDMDSGDTRDIADTELPAARLAISPNGSRIAALGSEDWSVGLFDIDLASGIARTVIEPPNAEDMSPSPSESFGLLGTPVWGLNGPTVAAPTWNGPALVNMDTGELNLPVALADLEDGYLQMLADNGMEDIDFHTGLPSCPDGVSFSPDGATLVFVFPCLVPYPSGIWTTEISTGSLQLLMGPRVSVGRVLWSPTGDRILIESASIETGTPELSSVSPDGTEQLLISEYGSLAAWSPTGSKLAYLLDTVAGPRLVVVDGEQSRTIVEFSDTERIVQLAWSPDGRYLVYAAWPSSALFIVDATGEEAPIALSIASVVPGSLQWK